MFAFLFYAVITLTVLIYLWLSWKWTYWTKKGVFQIQPTFPFGTMAPWFTRKIHLNDHMVNQTKEAQKLPFYGGYFLHKPVLIVKDIDLVRHILVKDFDHFVDRSVSLVSGRSGNLLQKGDLVDRIWAKQMISAKGEEWKNMRSAFSPIFTPGKMKAMLIFMQETCKELLSGMDEYAESGQDMELKNILGKYSMNTMASCAFGVNAESFSSKTSKFVTFASKIFESKPIDGLKLLITNIPGGYEFLKAFNIPVMKKSETEFFYHVIMSSLKHRRETKLRRNDLIDMMLDAIKSDADYENETGDQFEKDAKLNHHSNKKAFDDLTVVATAIIFLIAGYDTTGTTLAFILYQLAKNPDVQEKLRAEIEDVTNSDSENELTYDHLQSMTYLDQVINETLRLHNPTGTLNRITTKDYKMPGTNLIIPKGVGFWIPTAAIHLDENHYANPHVFDPDHFSKEAKAERNPYAFFPFGQGPRGCIGMRFALLETKLAVSNIVRKFNLIPSSKTKEPSETDPKGAVAYPRLGLYIKVEKRF